MLLNNGPLHIALLFIPQIWVKRRKKQVVDASPRGRPGNPLSLPRMFTLFICTPLSKFENKPSRPLKDFFNMLNTDDAITCHNICNCGYGFAPNRRQSDNNNGPYPPGIQVPTSDKILCKIAAYFFHVERPSQKASVRFDHVYRGLLSERTTSSIIETPSTGTTFRVLEPTKSFRVLVPRLNTGAKPRVHKFSEAI